MIVNKRNLTLRAQAQNLIEIPGTSCSSSPLALNRLGTVSRHGRLSAGGSILGCEGRACPLSLMASSPVQLSLFDNFIINLFINSSAADWECKQGQRACQISASTRPKTVLRAWGGEGWSKDAVQLFHALLRSNAFIMFTYSQISFAGKMGRGGSCFSNIKDCPPCLRFYLYAIWSAQSIRGTWHNIPFNFNNSICFGSVFYQNWSKWHRNYLRWTQKFHVMRRL